MSDYLVRYDINLICWISLSGSTVKFDRTTWWGRTVKRQSSLLRDFLLGRWFVCGDGQLRLKGIFRAWGCGRFCGLSRGWDVILVDIPWVR